MKQNKQRKIKNRQQGLAIPLAVRNYVRQSLFSRFEHKVANYNIEEIDLYNYSNITNFQNNNVYPISPYDLYTDITQGTGQGARIGNAITIVKSTVTLVIVPNPYNAVANPVPKPQDIWIIIVKLRQDGLLASLNTIMANSFFNNGSASSALTGTLGDFTRDINRDKLIIEYFGKFKLGYAIASGTGTDASNQSFANNDYGYNLQLKLDTTKFLTKNVIYNDATDIPESAKSYIIVNIMNADGTTTANTITPCSMTFTNSIQYNDA